MHRIALALSVVLACAALHPLRVAAQSPELQLAQATTPPSKEPPSPQAQPPAKKTAPAKAAPAGRVSVGQLLSEGFYVGGLSVNPAPPGNAFLVLQRDDTVYVCAGFMDLNQMNYPRPQFDKCAPMN